MWPNVLALAIATVNFCSVLCSTYANNPQNNRSPLNNRNYVDSVGVADSYDFVVVGGGLAGLVVASRLSEDPDTTVLVIEAGESGDAVPSSINPPAGTYYHSLVGSSYDWAHKTVPQSKAGNRIMNWPRGKLLGGSSAINGMYYVRPSEIELNTWRDMIAPDNTTTAESWAWDSFHKAMMKSETFTPPKSDIQAAGNIVFQASSMGSNGPLHATYPGFMPPVVGRWLPSLESLGIQSASDPAGGRNFGGFIAALSINPTNWTRSYSKSAYIDPLPPRKNLDILVSYTVTRIKFSDKTSDTGERVATGVEFASSVTSPRKVVAVKKEVVLTGGTLGSPHVLMHSGVGPKDVLDAASVPVIVELPGVGQHLQDHLAVPVVWEAQVETAGDIQASGSDMSKSAEFMSFVNSALAYVNGSTLFNTNTQELQTEIQDALSTSADTLVPSQYKDVVEGYKAIYGATEKFISGGVGQIELLLSINSPGKISIQAALQHPYSQGRVYINTSSIFDPIVVDPQYFSHFADLAILRQGIKLARLLGGAPPMMDALGKEILPGPEIATDEQLDGWVAANAQTEYHPSATCAMLPRSQGGVVNARLGVYGLANVRVADASVFPISFSTHLGSPTYGIAEQAADLIISSYKAPPVPKDSTPGSDPSGTKPNSGHLVRASSLVSLVIWWVFSLLYLCMPKAV